MKLEAFQQKRMMTQNLALTRGTDAYKLLNIKSPPARLISKWKPLYKRITWQKQDIQRQWGWVPWDAWQTKKIGNQTYEETPVERYSRRKFKGFENLISNRDDECPNARDVMKTLCFKFTDHNGVINMHHMYEAARFLDWWMEYIGPDADGAKVNQKSGFRENIQLKAQYPDYKPFNGWPPPPYRLYYRVKAMQSFWVINQFWLKQNMHMPILPNQTQLTEDEIEFVDNRWNKFPDTDTKWNEWGYMLNDIPERVRTSWGKSCLQT